MSTLVAFWTSCLYSVLRDFCHCCFSRTSCLYSVCFQDMSVLGLFSGHHVSTLFWGHHVSTLFPALFFLLFFFSGCHVTTFFHDIMSLLGSVFRTCLYSVFRTLCHYCVLRTSCLYSVCFQDMSALGLLSGHPVSTKFAGHHVSALFPTLVYFQDIMSLLSLLLGHNVSAQSVFEDIMSLLGLFSGHHVTTLFPGHHVSTWSVFRTSCLCSVCFQDIMLYEKKQNNWATHSLWQGLDRSLRKGAVTAAAAAAGGVWVGQLFNSAVRELWKKISDNGMAEV